MTKNQILTLAVVFAPPGVLTVANFFNRQLSLEMSMLIGLGIFVFLPIAIFTAIW